MNYSNYRLSLDIHDIRSNVVIKVKRGTNTKRLCISLTENGKVYEIGNSCTAEFKGKRPDGENLSLPVEKIDRNIIYFVMGNSTTKFAGIVESEIRITGGDGKVIASPTFSILVEDNIVDDDDVINKDEDPSTLTQLIAEATDLIDSVETKLANGEFKGEKGDKGDSVTVDDALSVTSTNPVQNCVIAQEIQRVDGGLGYVRDEAQNALNQSATALEKATEAGNLAHTASEKLERNVIPRLIAVEQNGGGSNITVDDALDETSDNPVQNKVVTQELRHMQEGVDYLEQRVNNLPTGGGSTGYFKYKQCGLPVLYLQEQEDGAHAAMIAAANADPENKIEKGFDYTLKTAKGNAIATGTCDLKLQGSSSLRNKYPKYNYTLKTPKGQGFLAVSNTDRDGAWPRDSERVVEGFDRSWGVQRKYCMKANFIDPSGARNVVSARLWGSIVASRADSKVVDAADARLTASPNCGAIDGFPVIIELNGEFRGLYTFNIPKDDWMFNGVNGEGDIKYIVGGESNGELAAGFYALATFPEGVSQSKTDFAIEYQPDDVTKETVVNSFNTVIEKVMNAPNSEEWESVVAPYLDIGSAIDYYIFTCCISGHDNIRKNILYGTYDGDKWFMSAYDLDTTFGSNPYGKGLYAVKTSRTQFAEAATKSKGGHRLFELIYNYSKDKLKKRYWELRNDILSDANVWYVFNNFVNAIPKAVYNADADRWASASINRPMHGTTTANVENFMQYYRMHCALLDKEMEITDEPVIPDEPTDTLTINNYPVKDGLKGLYDLGGTGEDAVTKSLENHAPEPHANDGDEKLEGAYTMSDSYVNFTGSTAKASRLLTYLRLPLTNGLTYVALFSVPSGSRPIVSNRGSGAAMLEMKNDGVVIGKDAVTSEFGFDAPINSNNFAIVALRATTSGFMVDRYTNGALTRVTLVRSGNTMDAYEGVVDAWSTNAIQIGGNSTANPCSPANISLAAVHEGVMTDEQLERICQFVKDYGEQKGLTIE